MIIKISRYQGWGVKCTREWVFTVTDRNNQLIVELDRYSMHQLEKRDGDERSVYALKESYGGQVIYPDVTALNIGDVPMPISVKLEIEDKIKENIMLDNIVIRGDIP